MKKLTLFMLALLVFSTSAFGAPKQKKKTKSNFYSSTPFNTNINRLPERYKGNNIYAILRGVETVKAEKSDYETTKEYRDRMAAIGAHKITPKITVGDTVSFVFDDTDQMLIRYDADDKAITLKKDLTGFSFFVINANRHNISGAIIDSIDKNVGSYIGQNGFGVKKRISKRKLTMVGICPFNDGYSASAPTSITGKFQADKVTGYIAEHTMGILVYGKLAAPLMLRKNEHTPPTFSAPYDTVSDSKCLTMQIEGAWAINTMSGDIFTKNLLVQERH